MGFAVRVVAFYDHAKTYLVKTDSEEEAKVRAYHQARKDFCVCMPDSLHDAETSDDIFVSVLCYIDAVIE